MSQWLTYKRFLLITWFCIVLAWGILASYALWLMIFKQPAVHSESNPEWNLEPVPTLTATPSPTLASPGLFGTEIASPTPTPPPAPNEPLPTPPSGGVILSLTPSAESVGWTSSLDGRSHFNEGKIHSGFFKGHVFHGALQFDLSELPPDSNIVYADLQLTGLNDRNLDLGGIWQVRLLDPTIDPAWFSLTYDKLRQAPLQSTLQPALPRMALASNRVNTFVFNEEQIALLEQHLKSGWVSFRIDGPSSGPDNLFTWDNPVPGPRGETLAGAPLLRVVVDKLNYVIITSTPTPENILTVAAQLNSEGTPTPLPAYWVTPVVVTLTPTPANPATATFQAQLATAEVQVHGTATLTPPNLWTATPEPLLIFLPNGAPTPLPPTPFPSPIPDILLGKIAFLSDRAGNQEEQSLVYVMDADGSNVFLLTDRAIYETAAIRERLTANQQFLAFVEDVAQSDGLQRPAIFFYDYTTKIAQQLTHVEAGQAHEPAWSPIGEQIAFVSDEGGAEKIWTINRDGINALQLTRDDPNASDKHPSWSPDGSQIVFWSNRTGKAQIWVMNADGSNQRLLHQSNFNDWSPVWIKYTDPVRQPLPAERFRPD